MPSRVQQSHSFEKIEGSRRATKRRSVLIVGAAGRAGKSLAGQLDARGFELSCLDTRPMDIPFAGCHVIAEAAGFLPALARLVHARRIEVVIPANSSLLPTISAGRAVLGTDVDLVLPAAGPATTAQDRLLTAWSLWSRGVAVPDFGVPSDFAAPTAESRTLHGPVMLRPRLADGSLPTVLVDEPGDIDWASLADDILVQQFVPGPAYKVVVYRPQEGKGRLTVVLEETILDGEVIATSVVPAGSATEVERVAQAAVRAVGLTCPVELAVRERADGVPVVLDVRAGFGPHSHLVPELLDAVLKDHPPRAAAHPSPERSAGSSSGRTDTRTGRPLLLGTRS